MDAGETVGEGQCRQQPFIANAIHVQIYLPRRCCHLRQQSSLIILPFTDDNDRSSHGLVAVRASYRAAKCSRAERRVKLDRLTLSDGLCSRPFCFLTSPFFVPLYQPHSHQQLTRVLNSSTSIGQLRLIPISAAHGSRRRFPEIQQQRERTTSSFRLTAAGSLYLSIARSCPIGRDRPSRRCSHQCSQLE